MNILSILNNDKNYFVVSEDHSYLSTKLYISTKNLYGSRNTVKDIISEIMYKKEYICIENKIITSRLRSSYYYTGKVFIESYEYIFLEYIDDVS